MKMQFIKTSAEGKAFKVFRGSHYLGIVHETEQGNWIGRRAHTKTAACESAQAAGNALITLEGATYTNDHKTLYN